jgi:hypothetical protein
VNVDLLSVEESLRVLALLRGEERFASEIVSMGVSIKGFIDGVCREADGSPAWEVHQPNLITDFGRRIWCDQLIGSAAGVFICGVGETPLATRMTLIDNGGTSTSYSTTVSATNDSNTNTKSWSYTFGTPGTNRTVAAIGLFIPTQNGVYGATNIVAYSLLSPPKTQSTTQTLELSYRLTMTPVA